MAEAIAKIKNGKGIVNCNTADTDGLLVNTLLEALTGTNRLNVGAYGRSTRTPTNYSAATQSIDDHLAGIDTVLGAGPGAHLMGSSSHTADTLANLNSKVTGGSLDFSTAARTPTAHAIGSSTYHSVDSIANLNSRLTDATLDTNTASRPPSGGASGDLSSNYPGPTVSKLVGQTIQTGTPSANDILQYISSQWQHVAGLTPDYDSGWFTIHYSTANSVAKTHGLGVVPRQVQVYFSTDSGTTAHLMGYMWAYGQEGDNLRGVIVTSITSTALLVKCGKNSTSGCIDTFGMGGTRIQVSSGKARVLCWK